MTFEVTNRLYLTENDEVVPEGDPDARWLYAVPGKRIPLEEAEKYGLTDSSAEPAGEPAGNPETPSAVVPSEEAAAEPTKKRRGHKK